MAIVKYYKDYRIELHVLLQKFFTFTEIVEVYIHQVKDLGWLNVCQLRDYITALTVFNYLAGLQPNYITDMFTLSRDIATRITRSSYKNKLFLPKASKCALQHTGATVWNNFPDSVRNIDTLNDF